MAHILAFPSTPVVQSGVLQINGFAYVSTMEDTDEIPFTATVSWTATQAGINSAIINAAIAAAENLGFTIGILDNRMVVAGAVGL